MNELPRLRWQCRRGMKELDVLLDGYLKRHYFAAPENEKQAFAALLELPDPVLMSYIMDPASPDTEEQRRVIEILRRTPGT